MCVDQRTSLSLQTYVATLIKAEKTSAITTMEKASSLKHVADYESKCYEKQSKSCEHEN